MWHDLPTEARFCRMRHGLPTETWFAVWRPPTPPHPSPLLGYGPRVHFYLISPSLNLVCLSFHPIASARDIMLSERSYLRLSIFTFRLYTNISFMQNVHLFSSSNRLTVVHSCLLRRFEVGVLFACWTLLMDGSPRWKNSLLNTGDFSKYNGMMLPVYLLIPNMFMLVAEYFPWWQRGLG